MLNRRLFDIVTQDRSSGSSNRRARVQQFTTKRLDWNWVRLYYRIQVLFRFIRQKLSLIAMIGQENYDNMLQNEDVRRMALTSTAQVRERKVLRTAKVNGHMFIIGEDLPLYQGEPAATADPWKCEHPNDELRIQGNKTTRSVYCRVCHRRWKRIDLEEFTVDFGETPRDDHTLNYGRYMSWKYLEVYREDHDYCTWTLQTADMNRGTCHESTVALKHFAQYIFLKDQGQLPRPGQPLLDSRPEIRNVLQIDRNRRMQARSVPNVPTVTHLPDMEGRLQDLPLSLSSTTDRRRTIAEANTAHDAAGDAGMELIGTEEWEFPREPFPPSI